eukprot:2161822-Rhodomonas_salina.1
MQSSHAPYVVVRYFATCTPLVCYQHSQVLHYHTAECWPITLPIYDRPALLPLSHYPCLATTRA